MMVALIQTITGTALQIRVSGPIGDQTHYQCRHETVITVPMSLQETLNLHGQLERSLNMPGSDKIDKLSRQINDLSTYELAQVLQRLNKETLEDIYRDSPK